MKIAYFDLFSGISGDMAIGALIDAGLDIRLLEKELSKLKVSGYRLTNKKIERGHISGVKFDCISSSKTHAHRSVREILGIIEKSGLSPYLKKSASAIFRTIGAAEAKIHGFKSAEDVQLHELGDIDSIIDITGVVIGLELMGIESVFASQVRMGSGIAQTKGGVIPLPAPASLEILKGIPVTIDNSIGFETVTPTGAGILKELCVSFGDMPSSRISSIGYGAGTKNPGSTPNMLRVVIGETVPSFSHDEVVVAQTNIDDMSPQNFGFLFDKLFEEGALDAYVEPIYMKKSRPAFKLTFLCDRMDLEKLSKKVFQETTTIGIRYHGVSRFKLDRDNVVARTKYGPVHVKVSRFAGAKDILTISPEYDDCAVIAGKKGVSLKKVIEEAKRTVKV